MFFLHFTLYQAFCYLAGAAGLLLMLFHLIDAGERYVRRDYGPNRHYLMMSFMAVNSFSENWRYEGMGGARGGWDGRKTRDVSRL